MDSRSAIYQTLDGKWPETTRLALTEAARTFADRLWREEMRRAQGPDAVLTYGCASEG